MRMKALGLATLIVAWALVLGAPAGRILGYGPTFDEGAGELVPSVA